MLPPPSRSQGAAIHYKEAAAVVVAAEPSSPFPSGKGLGIGSCSCYLLLLCLGGRHFLERATIFMRHDLDELATIFRPVGEDFLGNRAAGQCGMTLDEGFQQVIIGLTEMRFDQRRVDGIAGR